MSAEYPAWSLQLLQRLEELRALQALADFFPEYMEPDTTHSHSPTVSN